MVPLVVSCCLSLCRSLCCSLPLIMPLTAAPANTVSPPAKAFDDHSSIDYLGGSFDAVKSQYPEDICRGFIAPPRSAAVNASGWQFCVKLQPKPGADPKQQVRCTVVVNQTTGAICNHASSLVTCSSGIDTFENGHMKKWHKAEYTAMQACAGTLRSCRTTILPPPLLQVAGMATLWPRTCSRCKSAPT